MIRIIMQEAGLNLMCAQDFEGQRQMWEQKEEKAESGETKESYVPEGTGTPASLNGALYTGKKMQKMSFQKAERVGLWEPSIPRSALGLYSAGFPVPPSLLRAPVFGWPRGDREFLPSNVRKWKRREARKRNVT